jgi:FkbM family methyltransferase
MHSTKTLLEKTLAYYLFQEFLVRYRFKYVLPRIQELTLDGMKFDVTSLSPKIRNRLLSGAYEANEKLMCIDFLNKTDSVLEVGGAIGYIGLLCQKRIGITDYTCIEANPKTYEVLKKNYALNNIEPKVFNVALSHADGEVELEIGSDFWENSICFENRTVQGVKTVRVPSATLPSLIQLAGHPINTLIIDIEGAEQFINFSQLPDHVSKLIIELHPGVIGQEITYDIVARLVTLGFRVAREVNDTFVFLRK